MHDLTVLVHHQQHLDIREAVGVPVLARPLLRAAQFNEEDDVSITLSTDGTNANRVQTQIRRLTRPDFRNTALGTDNLLFVLSSNAATPNALTSSITTGTLSASFVIADAWANGPNAIGSIVGTPTWDLEALGTTAGGGDACGTANTGSAIAELDI